MRYYCEWDGGTYSIVDRREPTGKNTAPLPVARAARRDMAEKIVDALNLGKKPEMPAAESPTDSPDVASGRS